MTIKILSTKNITKGDYFMTSISTECAEAAWKRDGREIYMNNVENKSGWLCNCIHYKNTWAEEMMRKESLSTKKNICFMKVAGGKEVHDLFQFLI